MMLAGAVVRQGMVGPSAVVSMRRCPTSRTILVIVASSGGDVPRQLATRSGAARRASGSATLAVETTRHLLGHSSSSSSFSSSSASSSSGGGWMTRRRRSVAVVARAAEDRTSAQRARLDAIREEDELPVEDPGERGGFDMFSGGTYTPEVLANWESQNAFFFPRLLLFGSTAMGLAASIPQSIGGLFRGDENALSVLGTNVVFFAITFALTALDLKNRKSILDRLQRELALGDMQVVQRDKFRNERLFPLQSLRQAARVALVYGDAEKVARDLAAATPFRRRLEQSRILVVPVVERPSGASSSSSSGVADVGPGRWELLKDVIVAWPGAGAGRWLAWPTRNDAWAGYFRRLLMSAGADPAGGGYVTLGVNGQVRGSGLGSPTWDVLLSTFPRNRPGNTDDAAAEAAWRAATVDYDVTAVAAGAAGATVAAEAGGGGSGGGGGGGAAVNEKLKDVRAEGAARPIGTTLELPAEGPVADVLVVHDAFYDALSRGDGTAMDAVWAPAKRMRGGRTAGVGDSPLDRFVSGGARLDGWETVLQPDRRPEGLRLSDVDVTIERNQATVTVLETVANGATLLATQAYERVDEGKGNGEGEGAGEGEGEEGEGNGSSRWVLKSHYTIPYGKDTVAKIALRCDERGCVAVPAKAVASER